MTTFKWLIPVLLAAVTAGCGVGEASVASEDELDAATPVPVEVALPAREDVFASYQATATLESDADAPVEARVAGEVVALEVEEGQIVTAGQVLARLDGERLRLEMLAARADLDKARGEYQRYIDLNRRGLISASMFDGLKYEVEALEATYELRKLNFEYSSVRAPIDGVVAWREIKLGQTVSAGDVVFRITDTRELLADLMIPQSEIAKFSAGLGARLAVDAMPGRSFEASIDRVSPTIDKRNGTFRATAIIDNSAGELAPGMFARFTVAYEEHENALMIPVDALVAEDDDVTVYVVEDGAVSRRSVRTGIEADGKVEIVDGLDDHESVVVVGHSGLRDGSKVLANNRSGDRNIG